MKTSNFIAPADIFSLFLKFSQLEGSFFLDSSDETGYSFLGALPYKIISTLNDLDTIRHTTQQPSLGELPFQGGAVGLLSYEAVRQWEPHLKPAKKEPFDVPNIYFGLYDTFIAIDHMRKTMTLVTLKLNKDSDLKFEKFEKIIRDIVQKTVAGKDKPSPTAMGEVLSFSTSVNSNLSFDQYCKIIQRVKHYIEEGDIYQANISHCFHTSLSLLPQDIYRRLRIFNPAPFSAYIDLGKTKILSSSPERFIRVTPEGLIQTEPIKGTIRRGDTPEENIRLKKELLESEKNRAELMMIVDLERNDLGKICHFGTVKVPELMTLKTFSTVHHLVSRIEGKLKTTSVSDIIRATFPGGSITGAPKLRAMQIIDECEPHNRGIYTGSMGYIDYRGQIDLNIAIRTLVWQSGEVFFPVGGGIVSDSDPQLEYEETLHKGKGLIKAVST